MELKSTKQKKESEMEKKLKKARNLANKITRKLGRSDLDWTVQISINSTRPDRVNYCCQIQAPANGLEPITWVCDSWEELLTQLDVATKKFSREVVDKAWHESEIVRAEALIKYHKEMLENDEPSDEEDLPEE